MAKMGTSVKTNIDPADLLNAMQQLAKSEVLVGFPQDTTDSGREDGITNASLGYIHDNGAPEANIPARPFMRKGVEDVQGQVTNILGNVAKGLLRGKSSSTVDQGLHAVGLAASSSIKRVIDAGVEPPLSEATLRDRARRGREGAMWELAWRAAGAPASTELAKPLIDTGAMQQAITYVIRERKERK